MIRPNRTIQSRVLLRQFTLLSTILIGLLIVTGSTGIYLTRSSFNTIKHINKNVIKPSLEYGEIISDLNQLTMDIYRLDQLNSEGKSTDLQIDRTKKLLNKIDVAAKVQKESSKGLVFEHYVGAWLTDWREFKNDLGRVIQKPESLRKFRRSTNQRIHVLVKKMIYVGTYIQADANDLVVESSAVSKEAEITLIILLLAGVAFGLFSSFLIVGNIHRLFEELDKADKLAEEIQFALDASAIGALTPYFRYSAILADKSDAYLGANASVTSRDYVLGARYDTSPSSACKLEFDANSNNNSRNINWSLNANFSFGI